MELSRLDLEPVRECRPEEDEVDVRLDGPWGDMVGVGPLPALVVALAFGASVFSALDGFR